MRHLRLWKLIGPLLVAPALASAHTAAGDEQSMEEHYRCYVDRTLARGTVSLIRLHSMDGTPEGGDMMRWEPTDYDPSRPERPLGLTLSSQWDRDEAKIDLRRISIDVELRYDAELPEVAVIEIKRPFPVEPYGVIGSTALSTHVFPNSSTDRSNGHSEIPLGDLFAYAAGYGTLDWRVFRPSDRLGGEVTLAQGKFDIDALRDAVAALPALRTVLAARSANPRKDCEHISFPTLIIP
jgi:hypothetical protein